MLKHSKYLPTPQTRTLSDMLSIASIWDGFLFLHVEFSAAIQPVQTAKIC